MPQINAYNCINLSDHQTHKHAHTQGGERERERNPKNKQGKVLKKENGIPTQVITISIMFKN
jgi:hypothetical protein